MKNLILYISPNKIFLHINRFLASLGMTMFAGLLEEADAELAALPPVLHPLPNFNQHLSVIPSEARNLIKLSSLFIFTLLFSLIAKSQDSISIFKVVKSKTNFSVSPSTNVLWIGVDNKICIKAEGEGKIAKVEIAGATIAQKDSCYIARVTSGSGHEAVLSVYELLPNGKSQLALNKKYNIVSLPMPEILVCDVKSDSTIDKFSLMAIGKLTAKLKGTNEKLKVVSFEMQTGNQSAIDTLKSTNEKLSVEMKRVIDKMKPGSLILFNNIICRNAKGDLLQPQSVRIFLDEKTIYQYGF